MVKTIGLREMERHVERGEVPIVEVLGAMDYEEGHIPGASNIPVDAPDFKTQFHDLLPDRDAPIIVYCANTQCQASPRAARVLESLGYTDVMDFEAGKQGWVEAGHELEQAGQGRAREVAGRTR